MSGIAGIIHFDGAPIEPGLIEKMTAEMSHRGPDGTRFWKSGSVAFGHCMLHVTTESLEEVQPWLSEDGRYVLVMDGRLDNWEELRHRLELQGCRLRNRSDAELVMQAFQLYGIDCLKYIEGDFAFILWDNAEKKIHCIRDRMGAKPFHYHWNGKTLSFASELRALFPLPWIPKTCNEDMLVDYLMVQWCTKDETLWKDIYRLPQAHQLEIDRTGIKIQQYWQPELHDLLYFKSDDEYIECYRSLFIEAVRRSSRSHRTVAYEVSGGLDSSAIFAAADHLEKESRLSAPGIEGYTLDFHDDVAANELDYAHAVGLHLGRKIHEIAPSHPSLEWTQKWAQDYGEFPPYPNGTMGIGIRQHARSRGSSALVVGVGGDEWLVAGRSYYAEEIRARRWMALAKCWAADRRDFGLLRSIWWLPRFGLAPLLPTNVKKSLRKAFRQELIYREIEIPWLSAEMQEKVLKRLRSPQTEPVNKFGQIGQLSKWNMLFSPSNSYSREAEEKLASMTGMELRRPFFNLQLAQFAFSTPDKIRLRGRIDKFVHRQAMRGMLPQRVLDRESKADFMVTYRRYLVEMEDLICREIPSRRQAWVNASKVRATYRQTQMGPTLDGMAEWQLWGLFGCDAVCV